MNILFAIIGIAVVIQGFFYFEESALTSIVLIILGVGVFKRNVFARIFLAVLLVIAIVNNYFYVKLLAKEVTRLEQQIAMIELGFDGPPEELQDVKIPFRYKTQKMIPMKDAKRFVENYPEEKTRLQGFSFLYVVIFFIMLLPDFLKKLKE